VTVDKPINAANELLDLWELSGRDINETDIRRVLLVLGVVLQANMMALTSEMQDTNKYLRRIADALDVISGTQWKIPGGR
jgi:hypothetical protein